MCGCVTVLCATSERLIIWGKIRTVDRGAGRIPVERRQGAQKQTSHTRRSGGRRGTKMTLRFLFPPSVCVKSNYEFLQRAEHKKVTAGLFQRGDGGASTIGFLPQKKKTKKTLQSVF